MRNFPQNGSKFLLVLLSS
uniref:Pco081507 n=1 Tax=Arundo donax TaxID=35708 RepID=A0A0A9HNW6_ARUDO